MAIFVKGCIKLFKKYGVQVYVSPSFPKFLRDGEWRTPEKTAIFVGNVQKQFNRKSPVEIYFLGKDGDEDDIDSDASVADGEREPDDAEDLGETIIWLDENEPDDAEDLGETVDADENEPDDEGR